VIDIDAIDAQAELTTLGFKWVGAIRPDDEGHRCALDLPRDVTGFVIYSFVVGTIIKKFGVTAPAHPTLRARMTQNVSTINGVIAMTRGTVRDAGWHHRPFDAFKRLAPIVIQAKQVIDLWAQVYPSREMMLKTEQTLNDHYQPEWTKEGKGRLVPAK
jgi:hypothetical protein